MGNYHSNQRVRLAVLSAERSTNSAELNAVRTTQLMERLVVDGLAFEPARGMYEGSEERSFVVAVPRDLDLEYIRALAGMYEQDAILVINEYGDAVIEGLLGNGTIVPVGKWVEIGTPGAPSSTAGLPGWTEVRGRMYTTVVQSGNTAQTAK